MISVRNWEGERSLQAVGLCRLGGVEGRSWEDVRLAGEMVRASEDSESVLDPVPEVPQVAGCYLGSKAPCNDESAGTVVAARASSFCDRAGHGGVLL